MSKAYIVDALRTPVGKINGALSSMRSDDMMALVIKAMIEKYPQIRKRVDDVIIGCAMPEGEQGLNIARTASMLGGLPEEIPAYTINRFCASGLQSVANAASLINADMAEVVVAGGVESMTKIPMTGHNPSLNINLFSDDKAGLAYGMGLTAEQVVSKFKIDKDSQNQFAYKSHQKALKATEENLFADEIVPIEIERTLFDEKTNSTKQEFAKVLQDEGPRQDTSLEVLDKLKPAFAKDGSVTAGNSSQMSDGAGCVLVVSEKMLQELKLTPTARFVSYALGGVPPEVMGIGPVVAIPKSLKMAGLNLQDIEHIELNEAFAAQCLAVMKELQINPEVVNPQGGAIALGHPLGATGSIRMATLAHAFQRNKNCKYGMITMCIGGGMGAAGVFENVA